MSVATLKKLIEVRKKAIPEYECPMSFSEFRSLDECFETFKLSHELVDSVEAVKLATECVIDEFSDDGVVYLELRSTPRETSRMTKSQCLETIVNTIISCQVTHPNIIVKFLPSINISHGGAEARKNFQIFSELRKKFPDIVKGIDLGGDPKKGKFSDVKAIFEQARSEGFGIALHCAEVQNDEEVLEMLEFMTSKDRIGHGTFIDGNLLLFFESFDQGYEVLLLCNVLSMAEEDFKGVVLKFHIKLQVEK